MIPAFAVVGHPNKGKSAIVATLAEDTRVQISPRPGTTRHADRYALNVDGETLYELIDTPGFQRPGAVLRWLEAGKDDAAGRVQRVAEFVAAHANDPRFADECTLLRPLLDGAGILYVVDGTKPYASEYEQEMQILQWTGQPRMALINLIGQGDYVDAWRTALGQYFSIVRVFDAMQADFAARIGLLRAFGELHEPWREPLSRAVTAIKEDREQRLHDACLQIVDLLDDCLSYTEEQPLPEGGRVDEALENRLRERLLTRIRRREERARQAVQTSFRHEAIERNEAQVGVLAEDLFTSQNWALFGLDRTQLIAAGGVTGALTGGGLDLAVGGASLFLGSLVGAAVGSTLAWLGGEELAKFKVLGTPLGGQVARTGPVQAQNFPWVLLGRALFHLKLVSERNHALRSAFVSDLSDNETRIFESLPSGTRNQLARYFRHMRDDALESDEREAAARLLAEYLHNHLSGTLQAGRGNQTTDT